MARRKRSGHATPHKQPAIVRRYQDELCAPVACLVATANPPGAWAVRCPCLLGRPTHCPRCAPPPSLSFAAAALAQAPERPALMPSEGRRAERLHHGDAGAGQPGTAHGREHPAGDAADPGGQLARIVGGQRVAQPQPGGAVSDCSVDSARSRGDAWASAAVLLQPNGQISRAAEIEQRIGQ